MDLGLETLNTTENTHAQARAARFSFRVTTGLVLLATLLIGGAFLAPSPTPAADNTLPGIITPEIWLSGPTDGEPIIGPLTCTSETSVVGNYTVQLGTGNKVLETKSAWTEVLEFTIQSNQFENGPLELFVNLVNSQGQVVASDTLQFVVNNPEVTVVDVTNTDVALQIAGVTNDCAYVLFVGSSNTPSYSTEFGCWLPISNYAFWDCGLFPANYDGAPLDYAGMLSQSVPDNAEVYVVLLTWNTYRGWASSFFGEL